MKTLRILIVLITVLNIGSLVAKNENILVDVDGLVCSFCAFSIEKKLGKNKKIKKVKVDLEQRKIRIRLNPGQKLSDQEIRGLVKDSGYNASKITREK